MKVLGVVALAAVAAMGCAESTATADATEDPWSTKSADPEFVRRAEAALGDAPEPEDGWRVGVILAERGDDKYDWSSSVLTLDGVQIIDASAGCHDSDDIDEDHLPLMLDPGDLITWSREGDDNSLCTDEVVVVRKAVA